MGIAMTTGREVGHHAEEPPQAASRSTEPRPPGRRVPYFDRDLLAERPPRRLDLSEPGGVRQIEQAVHLHRLRARQAGQVGLSHPPLEHRAVERHLHGGERRQGHEVGPLGNRQRDLGTVGYPALQRGSTASTARIRAMSSSSPKLVTSGRSRQVAMTVPLSSGVSSMA